MRLFEALSGVDEKYLEACETAGEAEEKVVPINRFARFGRRYGKYAAAVLVLFVLGAGYYAVQSGGSKSENGMADAAAPFMAMAVQEEAPEDAMPEMSGETALDGENNLTGYANSGAGEKESSGENPEGKMVEQDQAAVTAGADLVESLSGNLDIPENSLELTAYLPTVWPAGSNQEVFQFVACSSNGGDAGAGEESYVVEGTYTDKERSFNLWISDNGTEMPDAGSEDSVYYAVDAFDRTCVEEAMKDGMGSFGVFYKAGDHYVLVEFEGDGTAEEIWKMFASIKPGK